MYNPFSLKGKTILVTGASSGIGQATAIECSKLGATLVITGRNEERLNATYNALCKDFEQQHTCIVADLSQEEDIIQFVAQVPQLDGVASNAGIGTSSPVKFIKTDDLMRVTELNTFSHVILAKNLFKKKLLKKGCSYIFTASIGGTLNYSLGNSIYGMSKAAINSFMKYCAVEFAARQIRCNSVCPGMIETPMNQGDGAISNKDYEADAQKYLLKRYGKPQEVAQSIAFLLSDASTFITGQALVVDGGVSINR